MRTHALSSHEFRKKMHNIIIYACFASFLIGPWLHFCACKYVAQPALAVARGFAARAELRSTSEWRKKNLPTLIILCKNQENNSTSSFPVSLFEARFWRHVLGGTFFVHDPRIIIRISTSSWAHAKLGTYGHIFLHVAVAFS